MNLNNYIRTLLSSYQNNSRKVICILKEKNLWQQIPQIHSKDSQNLYDFLYGQDKYCAKNNLKFISFSVGYRYCDKKCECCLNSISQKVSNSKNNFNSDQKKLINSKRQKTNKEKYGVENLFSDAQFIKESIRKKYGVDNARHIPGIDQKIKDTNLLKYGVDNPSKNQNIKNKQVQTWAVNKQLHLEKHKKSLIEKYGVDNARHIPGIDQKIKDTNLLKYGVDNPSKNQNIKNKISTNSLKNFYDSLPSRLENKLIPLFDDFLYSGSTEYYSWKCLTCDTKFQDRLINGRTPICRICNPINVSNFEQQIRNFLQIGEYNRRDVISPYELDIYIPQMNLAIECNGVYRHSELNGKNKNYHLNKTKMCNQQGIHLIQIFDVEWQEKRKIVESILNSYLGKNIKIYARKCVIQEIDSKTSKNFLKQNHIQGAINSKINLGLYLDNDLVSVMTFSKPRYNKNYEWELIRFCNKLDSNVVGGASKLFRYFIKKYDPVNMISYCDQRLFSGTVYDKLGFKKVDESSPGYYYFNTKNKIKLEPREKFQKHKLKNILSNYNEKLTEWENMKMNNYDRIWNCGNTIWEWKK